MNPWKAIDKDWRHGDRTRDERGAHCAECGRPLSKGQHELCPKCEQRERVALRGQLLEAAV